VDFDGGPQGVVFPQLVSWTAHTEPEVLHFAGSARYRAKFTLPAGWRRNGQGARIDLGRLWTIGEAALNGKPLGIAWTAPFTLDAGGALLAGENELAVEIVNTWHNRLVADTKLPAAERRTRTNVTVSIGRPWAELPLIESGLFGPVRLMATPGR
jgi:hypothetical protein